MPLLKNNGANTSLVMPFPDLDGSAGDYFSFYDITENLEIGQKDYNKYYQNIHNTEKYLHSCLIAFLALMGIMAAAFVGLLFFYCTVLRKIPDKDEDEIK